MPLVLALLAPAVAASGVGGFVPIPGGEMRLGRGLNQTGRRVRVEPFEILDHPVTNGEYRKFVQETGHPAPLHWTDGKIPAGKEDIPVIFVNRKDVAAISALAFGGKEGRILPAAHQRGVRVRRPRRTERARRIRGATTIREGKANYDADGSRRFDRWQDYLSPAR